MMTLEQYRLMKVAEEASEVAQRALKQMQYGKNEIQVGFTETNAERLRKELLDLLGWVSELEASGNVPLITWHDVYDHFEAKRAQINRAIQIAQREGQLEQGDLEEDHLPKADSMQPLIDFGTYCAMNAGGDPPATPASDDIERPFDDDIPF